MQPLEIVEVVEGDVDVLGHYEGAVVAHHQHVLVPQHLESVGCLVLLNLVPAPPGLDGPNLGCLSVCQSVCHAVCRTWINPIKLRLGKKLRVVFALKQLFCL